MIINELKTFKTFFSALLPDLRQINQKNNFSLESLILLTLNSTEKIT